MVRFPTLLEVEPGDRAEAGGKGASLARLARAGFAVPPGFVIPASRTAELRGDISEWPAAFRTDLEAALQQLDVGDGGVAVRSSATNEDSASASFAGQYVTTLDVRGEAAVLAAVGRCLASLDSRGATSYAASRGTGEGGAGMAVVVQAMVAARWGGVAFSRDPITGDPGRVVVELVEGSGERLVSGEAAAERFVFERSALEEPARPVSGGVISGRTVAAEAAMLAVAAEGLFGTPQDIEFAHDGRRTWMLQSRPITAAGGGEGWTSEFDTPTSEEEHWTSANIQEVLPGALTPLTMSAFSEYAHAAYNEGYQALGLLGKDESPKFVGLFYGRAFLNIEAMRLIADRAFGASGDSVEHRFLGGPPTGGSGRSSFRGSIGRLGWRLRSTVPLGLLLLRMDRDVDRRRRQLERAEARWRSDRPAEMAAGTLEERRRQVARLATAAMRTHLAATGIAGAAFEATAQLVRPAAGEGEVPALFAGVRGVESAEIGIELWALSRLAREVRLAERLSGPGFDPQDRSLPARWLTAFEAFIERNGHRGLNEMEIAAPTWRADPTRLNELLAAYLAMDDERSPERALRAQADRRRTLQRRIERALSWPRRLVFRLLLPRAQQAVARREETKSLAVRAMRLGDPYLAEVERRAIAAGVIAAAGDIFYLRTEEVGAFLRGDQQSREADVVRRRREEERNRYVRLPERFRGRPVPVAPAPPTGETDVLTGTPVSPGVITGRARVIVDPQADPPLRPGEVLVTPVADAGWAPMFALATALVVDLGSALSHGSTIAREYGLPAVVNVRDGTRRIRTGDLVTVDGTAGTVAIVERPN